VLPGENDSGKEEDIPQNMSKERKRKKKKSKNKKMTVEMLDDQDDIIAEIEPDNELMDLQDEFNKSERIIDASMPTRSQEEKGPEDSLRGSDSLFDLSFMAQ